MTQPSKKTHHVLHVEMGTPERYTAFGGVVKYDTDYGYSIECPGCNGWQECREEHSVEGYDGLNDGPDGSPEDAPWFEEEEFIFHGELHTWHWGHGWTVAYKGCVVRANESGDDANNIALTYGPGDYLVGEDWDDETVYLTALCMADGSPLPEGGWLERTIAALES